MLCVSILTSSHPPLCGTQCWTVQNKLLRLKVIGGSGFKTTNERPCTTNNTKINKLWKVGNWKQFNNELLTIQQELPETHNILLSLRYKWQTTQKFSPMLTSQSIAERNMEAPVALVVVSIGNTCLSMISKMFGLKHTITFLFMVWPNNEQC